MENKASMVSLGSGHTCILYKDDEMDQDGSNWCSKLSNLSTIEFINSLSIDRNNNSDNHNKPPPSPYLIKCWG